MAMMKLTDEQRAEVDLIVTSLQLTTEKPWGPHGSVYVGLATYLTHPNTGLSCFEVVMAAYAAYRNVEWDSIPVRESLWYYWQRERPEVTLGMPTEYL